MEFVRQTSVEEMNQIFDRMVDGDKMATPDSVRNGVRECGVWKEGDLRLKKLWLMMSVVRRS